MITNNNDNITNITDWLCTANVSSGLHLSTSVAITSARSETQCRDEVLGGDVNLGAVEFQGSQLCTPGPHPVVVTVIGLGE